MSAVVTLLCSS